MITDVITTKDAVSRLINELEANKDYFYTWQSSISFIFKTEYRYFKEKYNAVTDADIHAISNEAAKRFLNYLIYQNHL